MSIYKELWGMVCYEIFGEYFHLKGFEGLRSAAEEEVNCIFVSYYLIIPSGYFELLPLIILDLIHSYLGKFWWNIGKAFSFVPKGEDLLITFTYENPRN